MDEQQELLDRAQIIINMFRQTAFELQEKLIAEQVAHELTRRKLAEQTNKGE